LIQDASRLAKLLDISSSKALNAAIFETIASKLKNFKTSLSSEAYYFWPVVRTQKN